MSFPGGWLNHRYSAMLHCRALCKRNSQFIPSRGAKIFNLFPRSSSSSSSSPLIIIIVVFSFVFFSFIGFSSSSSPSAPPPPPLQLHSFGESSAERRSSFICSLAGPAIKRTHIQLCAAHRLPMIHHSHPLPPPNSASIETPLHSPISPFPFVAIQETLLCL